jgi:protein-disulfide isomerase
MVATDLLAVLPNDFVRGNAEGKITLIEFSDFECPYCNNVHIILKQLIATFPKELRWVQRHFPNTDIHRTALICAKAVEAAGRQGKYWEMHDALYLHQKHLDLERLYHIAYDLKLDREQFRNDLENEQLENRIREQYFAAQELGVTGTPTFYINGKRHTSDWQYRHLKETIQQFL